jgi:hypothetical protein
VVADDVIVGVLVSVYVLVDDEVMVRVYVRDGVIVGVLLLVWVAVTVKVALLVWVAVTVKVALLVWLVVTVRVALLVWVAVTLLFSVVVAFGVAVAVLLLVGERVIGVNVDDRVLVADSDGFAVAVSLVVRVGLDGALGVAVDVINVPVGVSLANRNPLIAAEVAIAPSIPEP